MYLSFDMCHFSTEKITKRKILWSFYRICMKSLIQVCLFWKFWRSVRFIWEIQLVEHPFACEKASKNLHKYSIAHYETCSTCGRIFLAHFCDVIWHKNYKKPTTVMFGQNGFRSPIPNLVTEIHDYLLRLYQIVFIDSLAQQPVLFLPFRFRFQSFVFFVNSVFELQLIEFNKRSRETRHRNHRVEFFFSPLCFSCSFRNKLLSKLESSRKNSRIDDSLF